MWLCVFLGVLAGDHVGFFVGRYAGKPLIQRLPYGRAVTRVESLIHRYGAWVPLFGRFVAPIRPILLLTLGMMGLSYRRFVAVEVAGAAIWTSFWLGMGVLGGSAIEYVSGLGPAMLWLSIGAMVVFGVLAWRFRQQLEALVLGDSEAPGAQAPQPAA